MRHLYIMCVSLFLFKLAYTQTKFGDIYCTIHASDTALKTVAVTLKPIFQNKIIECNKKFSFPNIPFGKYTIVFSAHGYFDKILPIEINQSQINIDVTLLKQEAFLEDIVVTGTKTFKRKTESAIIVTQLDSKTLSSLQVCNLSESLKFQPGLRVETDCQTCNYTQLRINGLQGGYAQILINGRPIFSPLMSLYGMEQLPVNMIDKIEVIRGGGSSLYGSSAIGGTVNVITKIPKKNSYEISTNFQSFSTNSKDVNINANSSLVSKNKKNGTSLFFNRRERNFYDANEDNFSEMPKLKNTSWGVNSFLKPTENQKIELSICNLNEYRFGGEMVDKPAHLTQQSEERTHHIWMVSSDYQINFNNNQSSFITYTAWQNTKRKHYTGIFPDSLVDIQQHLANPPYGTSNTNTFQIGVQLNHQIKKFIQGKNVLTIGSEFITEKVADEIVAYHYFINQNTNNWGSFLQSDWDIFPKLNLLSGARVDQHNLLNQLVLSPRLALLYKVKKNTQIRIGYGGGFRAPQAFDADLHIAFAGGGVSRVQLSPTLQQEKSKSLNASINYDKSTEKWIAGFTLEAFYTNLSNAFVLEHIGQDNFGEIFEKRNSKTAIVKGITFETRANFNQKIQIETGFTFQQSNYSNPITYITGIEATKTFLRTPNQYGFANINITPNKALSLNINYVYTGKMQIAHFGGADNFVTDEMTTTKAFSELNSKISYTFSSQKSKQEIEIFGGLKNGINQYQTDFDMGKNRDSNYIYGPASPKSIFLGFKIKSK